jgi:hypothetical protein
MKLLSTIKSNPYLKYPLTAIGWVITLIILLLICLLLLEQYCRWNDKSFLEVLHPNWFADITKFPNYDFKCQRNCNSYNMKVESGYKIMKQKSVVIAGLCINLGSKANTIKTRLEHLGGYFKDYRCVIFENDSVDDTRKILKQIQHENNKIILMDCSDAIECRYKIAKAIDHGALSTKRMEIMADYRNRLLEHIKQNYSNFDCIAMIDLDIKGPINIEGVANSFGFYNDWDSISAYGIMGSAITFGQPYYYDLLAYSDGIHNYGERHSDAIPLFAKINKYDIGDDPYLIKSGFCGLAFYKMAIFRNPAITYTPQDGKYKCEHLILHENMINHGHDKIYINPNMTVLVGTQGRADKLPLY